MCKLYNCEPDNPCHYCKRQAERAKKKPIPKVSEKRKDENKEYAKLKKVFLEQHKLCECGCGKKADDVHHGSGRGISFLDVSTWIALNRKCHIAITEHSKEAIEKGLSKSRLKN